jgi:hypothetical protein
MEHRREKFDKLKMNRTPKKILMCVIRKVPPPKIFHNQTPNNELNETPAQKHGKMP